MSKEIHVITVATHRTPAFLNFYSSLIRTNYNENNIHILGQGQKFQGWKWRTEQYLNKIKEINDPDALYVFCDSSDLFFIAGPTLLQKHYEEYKTPVVLSIQKWIGHISPNSANKLKETCLSKHNYCYPNCGFVMGDFLGSIKYLSANLNFIDDEQGAGYLLSNLSLNSTLTIDTNISLSATIVQSTSGNIDDWIIKERKVYSDISGKQMCVLHFPSFHYHYPYNEYLKQIFPDLPQIKIVSFKIRITLALVWSAIFLVLLFCVFKIYNLINL